VKKKIRLGVVIGGHPYDVPAFRELCNGMTQCDVYLQDLDNWAAARAEHADVSYDAFLFYNMNYWGVLSVRDDMDKRITDAIAGIGTGSQGIVVLHHALLSFTDMTPYSQVCGIAERKIRGFGAADIRTHVQVPDHAITKGLGDWTMKDEYFVIDPPDAASQVLLTTDHPQSMKELGWTRQHGKARVFCYQSGHGPAAYADRTFREVLSRGIAWVSGRI
jgi:type 1 glutamine amidotransferase